MAFSPEFAIIKPGVYLPLSVFIYVFVRAISGFFPLSHLSKYNKYLIKCYTEFKEKRIKKIHKKFSDVFLQKNAKKFCLYKISAL
jgi:hypothetical protein